MVAYKSSSCRQKIGVAKLNRICDLRYFRDQLVGHYSDSWVAAALPRISLLLENNFPTEAELLNLPALPDVIIRNQELEYLSYNRHLDGRLYLSHWKNIFYTNRLLGNQHLSNYQEDDVLIEELLYYIWRG